MMLTMLNMGEEARVQRVGGKEEIKHFLYSLGFIPGETVSVVTKINGNLIVHVKDARLALDEGMCNKIMVSQE